MSVLFIKKYLKSFKRNYAAGLDDLPPGMLKDCCDDIAKPLCHIINLSLVTTTVPSKSTYLWLLRQYHHNGKRQE